MSWRCRRVLAPPAPWHLRARWAGNFGHDVANSTISRRVGGARKSSRMHSSLLRSFRDPAPSACEHTEALTVWLPSLTFHTFFSSEGLVEEIAFEFQLARCAFFLVRHEVCGMGELICVKLIFPILESFLAVSVWRLKRIRTRRTVFGGCLLRVLTHLRGLYRVASGLEGLAFVRRVAQVCSSSSGVLCVAGSALVLLQGASVSSGRVCFTLARLPWRGVSAFSASGRTNGTVRVPVPKKKQRGADTQGPTGSVWAHRTGRGARRHVTPWCMHPLFVGSECFVMLGTVLSFRCGCEDFYYRFTIRGSGRRLRDGSPFRHGSDSFEYVPRHPLAAERLVETLLSQSLARMAIPPPAYQYVSRPTFLLSRL